MAITFNTALRDNTSGNPSRTFSFTNTAGSLQCLVLACYHLADTVSATYAGTSMSLVFTSAINTGADRISMFVLTNPATGANNVVVTGLTGADKTIQRNVIGSYNGVKQTGNVPEANNTNKTTSAGNHTVDITTIANGAWVMWTQIASTTDPNGLTPADGVERGGTLAAAALADSNKDESPAGTFTVGFTYAGGSQTVTIGGLSLAPDSFTATAKVNSTLPLLGVG